MVKCQFCVCFGFILCRKFSCNQYEQYFVSVHGWWNEKKIIDYAVLQHNLKKSIKYHRNDLIKKVSLFFTNDVQIGMLFSSMNLSSFMTTVFIYRLANNRVWYTASIENVWQIGCVLKSDIKWFVTKWICTFISQYIHADFPSWLVK